VPADRAAAPRTPGLRPRGACDGFATGVVADAGQAHTPWRTRPDCAAARAARHRVPGLEQLGADAPNANDFMERWVRSVRRECLDRMLIVGRRQLVHVLRIYIRHYNYTRPHRALDLRPPDSAIAPLLRPVTPPHPQQVKRHDLLGGLIHEYELAPA
jgi:transposase InsO family protein